MKTFVFRAVSKDLWSNVVIPDARNLSLHLKRLKLRGKAWIIPQVLSITLEILLLPLLERLLLVLILLLLPTGVSPSLFAEFRTTVIALSRICLMSSLQWVFAVIFSNVLIWKNVLVRTWPEKQRLFSPALYAPLILFQIQIGCTHKIRTAVKHIFYFDKIN